MMNDDAHGELIDPLELRRPSSGHRAGRQQRPGYYNTMVAFLLLLVFGGLFHFGRPVLRELAESGRQAADVSKPGKTDIIANGTEYIRWTPTEIGVEATKTNLETLVLEKAGQSDSIGEWESYLELYPQGQGVSLARQRLAFLYFENAKKENTPQALQAYLKKYSSGLYADEARTRIDGLTFEAAAEKNTIEAYREYLERYPSGGHARAANQEIEKLVFASAQKTGTARDLEDYLTRYPQGRFRRQADELLEAALYQEAASKNSYESYQSFLTRYPDGPHSKQAGRSAGSIAIARAREAILQKDLQETSRWLTAAHQSDPQATMEFLTTVKLPVVALEDAEGMKDTFREAGFLPFTGRGDLPAYRFKIEKTIIPGQKRNYKQPAIFKGTEQRHDVRVRLKGRLLNKDGKTIVSRTVSSSEKAPVALGLTVKYEDGKETARVIAPTQDRLEERAMAKARRALIRKLEAPLTRAAARLKKP